MSLYIREGIMEDLNRRKNFEQKNPHIIFIIGFVTVILIGSMLLSLPIATQSGVSIGFIDALFTSTSATCVTGLAVVNTAQHWSVFGKIIIIILIQIGGLGVMTMATLISFFLGKKITLKTRILIMEERNVDELHGVVKLTKNILVYTFGLELLGAILLSFVFIKDYGVAKGIGFSIFHSISSFCNAGFDLFGNSLIDYVDNAFVNFVICFLIIIGGLGFFVFMDIYKNKGLKKLTLHSKLVLIITVILLIGGALLVFFLEYDNSETMSNLSFLGKIQASLFQSITTRTAGFNTIEISDLRMPSIVIFIFLMFIGGSPASTAGGIKTTTIGVVFIAIYNLVKGNKSVEIFEKKITGKTILKAVSVIGLASMLIFVVTVILTITEADKGFDFLDIFFEVVSASATVGLTRGLTAELSFFGRVLLTIVMFVGRVGSLTVVYAFLKEDKKVGSYSYPEGKIIIG